VKGFIVSWKKGKNKKGKNACANLAKACVVAKDLSRAYEMAIRAGNLFINLLGSALAKIRANYELAEKL